MTPRHATHGAPPGGPARRVPRTARGRAPVRAPARALLAATLVLLAGAVPAARTQPPTPNPQPAMPERVQPPTGPESASPDTTPVDTTPADTMAADTTPTDGRPARPLPVSALGPRGGRLAPCPRTPNCVSSFETGGRGLPAIPYAGDRQTTEQRLFRALGDIPRVVVARREGDYVRAEFTSRLFEFVDDVEFLFDDAAQVVHFRSASRTGRGDLGANRRRMRALTDMMRTP
jgi:uncharacterized protein (DUF1499 family)